jgi:hypothetical protein
VAWRHRKDDQDEREVGARPGVGTATVAAVTFANGGDNIGVYVPVFAVVGPSGMPAYVIVFLIGVGVFRQVSWPHLSSGEFGPHGLAAGDRRVRGEPRPSGLNSLMQNDPT